MQVCEPSTRLCYRLYATVFRANRFGGVCLQVVLEEARGAYPKEIVQELRSDTVEHMEETVERTAAWAKLWKPAAASK